MNADQKKRATELLANWRTEGQTVWDADRMAALLQELIDAEPAKAFLLTWTPGEGGGEITDANGDEYCFKKLNAVEMAKSILGKDLIDATEPVAKVTGYYGGHLSISTIDGRVLPAGTALYLDPPAPSVPDGWREAFTKCKDAAIASGAFESYKAVGEAFDALEAKLAAQQQEPPADVARDAERYRWLTADHASAETRLDVNNIASSIQVRSYAATSAAIDAAIKRQGGE